MLVATPVKTPWTLCKGDGQTVYRRESSAKPLEHPNTAAYVERQTLGKFYQISLRQKDNAALHPLEGFRVFAGGSLRETGGVLS